MMKKAVELFVKKMCTLLRVRRYALGWSQAKLYSISKTDSCRIENGKTDPTVSRFVRLCRGSGISPGWLLVLSEMSESGALSERELIEVVKNWDAFKKKFIAIEYMIVKSIAEKHRKGSKMG
ncbi:MAG: helix-turn-helix transcriptional regulator [candidate division Zixibacteria bacterium]|nr:helix-turn-helix transcriptional regulator [candidate division Zixibacteria bacterium]